MTSFRCRRCGACCKKPGFVYLENGDAERLAKCLQMDIYRFTETWCLLLDRRHLALKKRPDETCSFLEEDDCAVYEARPLQCRDFPLKWKTEKSLNYCEGLKKFKEGAQERNSMDTKAYLAACLEKVIDQKGQDVFLKAGTSPRMRLGGQVMVLPLKALSGEEVRELADELMDSRQKEILQKDKSVDFGFSFHDRNCRFRANAFFQQGDISLVFRLLWKGVPSFEELRLPSVLNKVALEKSGIILIGGSVSSGKTTTVAAILRTMNENVPKHILTIEDPVEYLHEDKKCLIQQREIGQDAESFSSAMKYVVRQSPDVIVIGEMRDAESFNFALSAAEVGRLVISTVHAQSAGQVFDRVLGFFPPVEREAALRYFAANMSCIMVQKLLEAKDGTLVPAAEVLLGSYTIKQLILDKKIDKIPQAIRNARAEGMQTMDQSILELWKSGLISAEAAIAASSSPEELRTLMRGIRIGQDTKILGE